VLSERRRGWMHATWCVASSALYAISDDRAAELSRDRPLQQPGPISAKYLRMAALADRRYWAFFANPRVYRIQEAIANRPTDLWTTKGRAVHAGDRVLIWKGAGNDGYRGVVALGEVLSDPELRSDAENPYWVQPPQPDDLEERVVIRYVVPPGLPLLTRGEPYAALDILAVSRARGGTVFAVLPEQWEAVVALAGGWLEESPETQAARSFIDEYAGRRPAGQGPQISAAARRVVENRAMELAKAHYTRQGWVCEDVSLSQSYDLRCTRSGAPELHVEVKGTTSAGSSVLLTPNEVAHARAQYPNTALVVVTRIEVTERSGDARASGGALQVFEPWEIAADDLDPVGYTYWLRSTP
jgi:hypothetical protein